MLLAFQSDQFLQRCSNIFRKVWKEIGTKSKLWFMIKAAFMLKKYAHFKETYFDIAVQFNVKLE
jgi:hypothetical protein